MSISIWNHKVSLIFTLSLFLGVTGCGSSGGSSSSPPPAAAPAARQNAQPPPPRTTVAPENSPATPWDDSDTPPPPPPVRNGRLAPAPPSERVVHGPPDANLDDPQPDAADEPVVGAPPPPPPVGRVAGEINPLEEGPPVDGASPPPILDPLDYPKDKLSPGVALKGMGSWVVIEKVRYFAPHTYVKEVDEEWMPYRHGYWAWDSVRGFTWISYDPWGWMTDHYGIWRHHAKHGWLWMPFRDHHYEPHCVSWFDDGDHIGWYPYHASFTSLYIQRPGFDDGFWLGLQVGLNFGTGSYRYHPGFSIVPRAEITNVNVVNVIINRSTVFNVQATTVIQNSFVNKRVFAFPGGDRAQARAFVEAHTAKPVLETKTTMVRTTGGAQFLLPKAVNPVPADSAAALKAKPGVAPATLGTVAPAPIGKALPASGSPAPAVTTAPAAQPVPKVPVPAAKVPVAPAAQAIKPKVVPTPPTSESVVPPATIPPAATVRPSAQRAIPRKTVVPAASTTTAPEGSDAAPQALPAAPKTGAGVRPAATGRRGSLSSKGAAPPALGEAPTLPQHRIKRIQGQGQGQDSGAVGADQPVAPSALIPDPAKPARARR